MPPAKEGYLNCYNFDYMEVRNANVFFKFSESSLSFKFSTQTINVPLGKIALDGFNRYVYTKKIYITDIEALQELLHFYRENLKFLHIVAKHINKIVIEEIAKLFINDEGLLN